MYPAIPVGITNRTCSVSPGIYLNFHIIDDSKLIYSLLYYYRDMNIKKLVQDLGQQFLSFIDNFLDRVPEEKRFRLFLISGGFVFLVICLTVILLAINVHNSREIIVESGIPGEELFYFKEPDFVPSLLFENEPHQPWTAGDLELFWKDPKLNNEDKWLELVKTTADQILENVP